MTATPDSRRWEGYGSAPCMADEDDEPTDTLEADLAASLRALGIEPACP